MTKKNPGYPKHPREHSENAKRARRKPFQVGPEVRGPIDQRVFYHSDRDIVPGIDLDSQVQDGPHMGVSLYLTDRNVPGIWPFEVPVRDTDEAKAIAHDLKEVWAKEEAGAFNTERDFYRAYSEASRGRLKQKHIKEHIDDQDY